MPWLGRAVSAKVLNMATLAPVDEETLVQAARETGAVVTAEEHYLRGGLNSIVSQVLAARAPAPMEAVAVAGYAESGKPQELLERYGLTPAKVADAARRAIARQWLRGLALDPLAGSPTAMMASVIKPTPRRRHRPLTSP